MNSSKDDLAIYDFRNHSSPPKTNYRIGLRVVGLRVVGLCVGFAVPDKVVGCADVGLLEEVVLCTGR